MEFARNVLGEWMYRIWEDQERYNNDVLRERLGTVVDDLTLEQRHAWTKEYILGMMSELDEVLREIKWKQHRRQDLPGHARDNMREELADLTKYVLSMWQLWGFSLGDLLRTVAEKNTVLTDRWAIEHSVPEPDQKILIVDLDGTLADWFQGIRPGGVPVKSQYSLSADIEFGMDWEEYTEHKHHWEADGGYYELEPYNDAAPFMTEMSARGWYIIVCTARPYPHYRRVWKDTVSWLRKHSIPFNELHIGREIRLNLAVLLRNRGHKVVLIDDDPETVQRASNTGLTVWMRAHPYNQVCYSLKGVRRVVTFGMIPNEVLDAYDHTGG